MVTLEEIREEDPLNGGDMSSPTLGETCCKTTQAQVSVERITSRLPCRSCALHCLLFAWSENLCVHDLLSVDAVQFLQDDAEKDPRIVT